MKETLPFNSGIYKITNLVNGKVYIGSSKDIKKRWSQHKRYLNRGVHHSFLLQRSWNKHGQISFSFECLEESIPSLLIPTEQKWMDSYKCYNPSLGYNILSTACGSSISKETYLSRRKFDQDTLPLLFELRKSGKSVNELSKQFNVAHSTICMYLRGQHSFPEVLHDFEKESIKVSRISGDEKDLILKSYLEGSTNKEISTLTGRNKTTITRVLSRAGYIDPFKNNIWGKDLEILLELLHAGESIGYISKVLGRCVRSIKKSIIDLNL